MSARTRLRRRIKNMAAEIYQARAVEASTHTNMQAEADFAIQAAAIFHSTIERTYGPEEEETHGDD